MRRGGPKRNCKLLVGTDKFFSQLSCFSVEDEGLGDEDDEDGQVNEEEGELDDVAIEIRREKESRRSAKAKRRAEEEDDDDEGGEQRQQEEDEENDFIFEQKGKERRIVNVDGEKDEDFYGRRDIADLERELGTQLEPFHLRSEMESGFFDADGSYVRRGVRQSDAWLDHMDEMEAAGGGAGGKFRAKWRVRPEEEEEEGKKKEMEQKGEKEKRVEDAAETASSLLLDDTETVARALKRYAEEDRAARKQGVKIGGGGGGGVETSFSRLTRAADDLLGAGQLSVYGMKKSELVDIARKRKRSAKVFFYVIRGAGENGADSQPYGPFSADSMMQWQRQGFFDQADVQVFITIGPNKAVRKSSKVIEYDKELDMAFHGMLKQ